MKMMRAGRARWKIENETFNTLKNQGYDLKHNYGHGENHLSSVLSTLMMLAFLVDQIQLHCCAFLKAALVKQESLKNLREKTRSIFRELRIHDWKTLYQILIYGNVPVDGIPAMPGGP